MPNIFYIAAVFAVAVLVGCSPSPKDNTIATIGNTALFASDAEFLAAIKPAASRNKEAIKANLQATANTRRIAEAARILFAGENDLVQKNLTESEDARLAQVYSYFYLQSNMRHSNKELLDFYNNNKELYGDYSEASLEVSVEMPLAVLREKIAADLFLKENPELAANVNDSNKTAVIDSARRAMMMGEVERLKKLYSVELVKIEVPGIEEYYKNNPEEFKTKTEYKLLKLSDKDSSVLATKIKGIAGREDFAKIAEDMPFVKQGHAIMEIGMLPALDMEVSKLGAKKLTAILRAPDNGNYYVFFIDSIIEPQLKPFDRAKNLAKSIIEGKGDFPLDSATVLATIDGKPFVIEQEVLELQEKLPPARQGMLRRDAALNNLVEKKIFARAAKEKGLDKSFEYIAWTRQLTDQAYSQILTDSVLTSTLGISQDTLKAAFDANKELFAPKAFEEAKLDVAVWLSIPDIAYRREFVLNKKYADSANWESIKKDAYKTIRYREFANAQERVSANLLKNVAVAVVDTSWGLEFIPDDFAGISESAKAQYDARDLKKARMLWERARALYPESDSIQKITSYELANIYQETNLFANAIDEYNVIIGLWGADQDSYKAYFMQGFVQSEYLKNDSLALISFEGMLEKFPNSELSADAKIMADNIKSGGKVLEDLIKKIEAAEEE